MKTEKPISFNPRVPRELKMFIEMTEDVYSIYEDVKWSNKSDLEIGFIYKNKKKTTEYFFGIWYDLWETYGIPLSITFSYTGKAPVEWHDKLKSFISKNMEEGIIVKDYEGWTCVLFDYSYFKFDKGNDAERLSKFYFLTTDYADSIATE